MARKRKPYARKLYTLAGIALAAGVSRPFVRRHWQPLGFDGHLDFARRGDHMRAFYYHSAIAVLRRLKREGLAKRGKYARKGAK